MHHQHDYRADDDDRHHHVGNIAQAAVDHATRAGFAARGDQLRSRLVTNDVFGDFRRQTEQAFENIKLALAAAGATWKDVVKTNLYVVGLKPEHVPIIREVRGRYISAEHPPASTLVGISALVGANWLIEIEAEALVDK